MADSVAELAKGNFWDQLMATDEGAAVYMESYGEGPGCETRKIVAQHIGLGESVLDVGCGPGWNIDHFEKYGPAVGKYKGLDYSERFVRVANARHEGKNLFEHGDCRHLNEPDDSWDVVILQDVLEHTNGYSIPVHEALRVAKKRIIISFWHLTDSDDHINDDGNDGYGAWYSRPKWEEFLSDIDYNWHSESSSPDNVHQHVFYIIDKENS